MKAAPPLDGVLLDLHGAMVAEGVEDGEGALLGAVREVIGPDLPVAVTLDFHANVTAAMARHATLLHGYKTYPHVDMAERGQEAAARLADMIEGRLHPTVALRQPLLLPPIAGRDHGARPHAATRDIAAEMERHPDVITISVFAGFPMADIHDAGLSVYVATNGDQALAEACADRLADTAWEHRQEFLHRALPVREAVAQALALATEGRPVVLADIADNTGGGAAGDTTEVLREVLRVGARGTTVACLWDPEAVAACVGAGTGATVTLPVGGKIDPRHGAPITVTGRVAHTLRRPLRPQGPDVPGARGTPGPNGGPRRR